MAWNISISHGVEESQIKEFSISAANKILPLNQSTYQI